MNTQLLKQIIEEIKINEYKTLYEYKNKFLYKIQSCVFINKLLNNDLEKSYSDLGNYAFALNIGEVPNYHYVYLYYNSKSLYTGNYETYHKILDKKGIKLEYHYPLINEKKDKKITSIINKTKIINDFKKKEKLLLKIEKYNDTRIYHELGLLYKTNNLKQAMIYFLKSSLKNHNLSAIELADIYHNQNDIDNEIYSLYNALTYENTNILLRLVHLLIDNNKPLNDIIPYLEDRAMNSIELTYELAKLYEEGIHVKKDLFSAYILYASCDAYLDSKQKIKKLANDLKEQNDNILLNELTKLYDKKLKEEYKIEEEKQAKLLEQQKLEQEEFLKNKELYDKYPEKDINVDMDDSDYYYPNEETYQYVHKCGLYKYALSYSKHKKHIFIPKVIDAANEGHSKAMMLLYEYYLDIDNDQAYEWLKKAFNHNNKEAIPIYNEYKSKLDEIKKEQRKLKLQQQKLEKEKQKLEAKNIFDKYTNDVTLLKQLFIDASNDNKEAIDILEKYINNKNLNINVLNTLEELALDNILYVQKYLHDYYLNYKNDRLSAKELIKKLYDSNMPYLINRIVIDHNLCEAISKLPYDEYYKVVIECVLSNKYNDDNVEYIKGMLYKYPNLANIYGYQASDTKAFEIFHKLTKSKDYIIVRRANNNLAHMYENGVGTKKDIEKAIEYYELSDVHSYAENLKLKMKKEQEEKENIRLRQALIEKYAHNKFDEFVKNYPKRSSEVINCYMKHALYRELEKELIERNKLLDKGIPANEIYEKHYYIERYLNDQKQKEEQEQQRLLQIKLEQERLQQLQIKLEQERLQQLKTKENKKVEVATSTINPEVKKVNKTKLINHIKSDYNKELYQAHLDNLNPPIGHSRNIYDQCVRLAKFKASYNCPIEPIKSNYSRSDYKIVFNNYRENNSLYLNTIYALENPIKNNYNPYRIKTWELHESDKLIASSNFIKLCQQEFNKKYPCEISIKKGGVHFSDNDGNGIHGVNLVENMLAYVPMYVTKLTLNIHVYMDYEVQMSSEYLDLSEAFENSELSKIITWEEFSSTKSGYHGVVWQASYNDDNAQSNYNAKKNLEAQKVIEMFIKLMFEKYYVFAGDTVSHLGLEQYIEGLVKGLRFLFHFHEK